MKEVKEKALRLFRSRMFISGNAGYRYFRERGLTNETMSKFLLSYDDGNIDFAKSIPEATTEELEAASLVTVKDNGKAYSRFWKRVIFPIWNEDGELVGFGGRRIEDSDRPKYVNSKEDEDYKKNSLLYGLNFAKASEFDSFILCEGYMDVISLHQAGYTNAIAACGTAITDGHIEILKRYGRKIYVATDTDEAGQKAAHKTVKKLLEADIPCARITFKPCKDVDEFLQKGGDMEAVLTAAEDPEHFLFASSSEPITTLKWLLNRKMSELDISEVKGDV